MYVTIAKVALFPFSERISFISVHMMFQCIGIRHRQLSTWRKKRSIRAEGAPKATATGGG